MKTAGLDQPARLSLEPASHGPGWYAKTGPSNEWLISKQEGTMPVKIVSDTGCDLPPALIEQYDIHLVPLILRFGPSEVPVIPFAVEAAA